jgi:hypothetical protein
VDDGSGGLVMNGGSGGALVLLLIVRNFQRRSCNWITVKFAMLSVFAFGGYGCLLEAGCSRPSQAPQMTLPTNSGRFALSAGGALHS